MSCWLSLSGCCWSLVGDSVALHLLKSYEYQSPEDKTH
jgi:hypothetical protein